MFGSFGGDKGNTRTGLGDPGRGRPLGKGDQGSLGMLIAVFPFSSASFT